MKVLCEPDGSGLDMMERMSRLAAIHLCTAAGIGAICLGQIAQPPNRSSRIVEITLPKDVPSAAVFIRYALAGQDFGGWVQRKSGVSSYVIDAGRLADRIRGIVYARGCALQTFDLALSTSNYEQYPFSCQPLSDLRIAGTIIRSDRLYGRQVKLQAKYVVRWAQQFLRIDTELLTSIPVGDPTDLSSDETFRLSIPAFAEDPIASAQEHESEIQIWATDKTTGKIVALLVPTTPFNLKTRVAGLGLQHQYPSEIIFTPCATRGAQVHDAIGFARRPDISDACN